MILIGPTRPAKITLPQSLTPQHLTKLPKPQKRLNSEYPRSIHPRSALQFAFYILVYNSQASAFLFSADPLSLRLSPPFCLFTALQREPLFTSSKEQNLPEKTRKILSIHPLGPDMLVTNIEIVAHSGSDVPGLMSQVALTRSGFFLYHQHQHSKASSYYP